MSALREREINNNLEQRLTEEQKLRGKKKLLKFHQFLYPKTVKSCSLSSVKTAN
jgi:hypothetical protein